MTRRLGLNLLGVVALTTMLGAAPAGAPVADAAARGDRDAVRTLLKQGADASAAQGDGMTALHWAAERGDVELATMLVFAGANLGAVTRIGQYTPLHLASQAGNAAVVEMLITAGADVTARTTTSGVTPLHLAAEAGSADAVTMLLARGADPNARESEWGQTPLIFAAAGNRVAAIRVLLAAGADPRLASHTVDVVKQQALDRAAKERQREVLKSFGVTGDGKATPSQLQAAVEAARELYRSGKIPEKKTPADEREAFREFFGDPFPTITAKGGLTPLLHAARQGNIEAALALVDGGADVNQVSVSDATSPLLMAVINGQFDLALRLVERGADPNLASTTNGVTPLWAAVNAEWQPRTRYPQPQEMELQKATYLDVMEAVLEAGADPDGRLKLHPWYMVYSGCGNQNCGLADTAGSTAFWRAAYATDLSAMRLLVKYGADPNIPTIAPPQRRRPPQAPPAVADTKKADASVTKTPASAPAGAVGAAGASAGQARASAAAVSKQGEGSVAAGATPGAPAAQNAAARPPITGSGDTPLPEKPGLQPVPYGGPGVLPIHAASGVGYGEGFAGNAHRHAPDAWLPVVKYLVEELHADVNARDNNGYTALHHAASRGDNELILYLVQHGADIKAESRTGQTVADMANGPVQRVSPFPETVALLEKLGSRNNHRCVTC